MSVQKPPGKPQRRRSIHSMTMEGDTVSYERMSPNKNKNETLTDKSKISNSNSKFSVSRDFIEDEKLSNKSQDSRLLEDEQNRVNSCLEKETEQSDTMSDNSDEEYDGLDPEMKAIVDQCQRPSIGPISWILVVVFIVVAAILAVVGFGGFQRSEGNYTFDALREKYPTQDKDFWLAIESGVTEVKKLERPSTFILVYTPKSEKTLSYLLDDIIRYSRCELKDCSKKYVRLTDKTINQAKYQEDYGYLITDYKSQLEEQAVMVVENIQNVDPIPAQAFHSFCDQETPLVAHSIIFFTMKVEELPDGLSYATIGTLEEKWADMKSETREALLARMANMILGVQP